MLDRADEYEKSRLMPAFLWSRVGPWGAQSRHTRSLATALLFVVLAPLFVSAAETNTAEREINGLIAAVETSGCVFIRNGDRHDAEAAADHLRLKYRRGRRYADTAEHFIERLASKSSWSGKLYMIECEGQSEPSGDWLRGQLAEIRRPG